MANLTARTAYDGLLPISADRVTVTETAPETITWLAPAKGKSATVSKALEKQIGGGFPTPGQVTGGTTRAVWFGPRQALVLGGPLKPITGAAVSDQTSAWASCVVEGAAARDVLARLVPIDLRDAALPVGACARTLLGHMACVLIRSGAERYDVMVFRSMAATATHELERAMTMVAAREALAG